MANFFKVSKKVQSTGQLATVNINKLDHNGVGVGKYKGKTIFVATALPGEEVVAKVVENKNKFIKAQLVSIKQQSPHRVEPPCAHFYQCGGCDFLHLNHQEQLVAKQQKLVELFGRNNLNQALPWQPALVDQSLHYRRKARIGVQYDKTGRAVIGFRKSGTNQLVNIKNCHILAKPYDNIFPLLNKLMAELSLHKSVGHIELIVTDTLTLVVRQLVKINKKDKACWQGYAKQHNWQVYLDEGDAINAITDVKPLSYQLLDNTTIYFQADDFIQVNAVINEKMIEQALNWLDLTANDRVLDLFCGLGNFSLPIAKKVQQVVGIEGVQNMVERSTYNAQINGLENCQFYQADLNADWQNQPWAQDKFSHVVLDPARAGAFEAIPQIVQLQVNTILYVSCDPHTLARDSEVLVASGYKIKKIMLMDMFSQTKHIETMVLFSL